jgi:hypothetical protein
MDTVRKMIVEELEKLIKEYKQSNPIDAEDAKKCIPYIKCFQCLDTERFISDRAVLTAFGYDPYMIKSCPCTGSFSDIQTTTSVHHTYRNRPVQYNGNHGTRTFQTKIDILVALAQIYRKDYLPIEVEAERKRKAAADEAARIREEERQRIIRENEEKERQREKERLRKLQEEEDRKRNEEENARALREKKAREDEIRRKREEELKPYQSKSDDELHQHASWDDIKRFVFNHDISDTEFSADIEGLVKEISAAIEIYSGNLLALSDLARNLDMKFRNFKSHENKQDTHIQVKEDKDKKLFFMRFVYTLLEDEKVEHCCFMDRSRKVKKIDSHLIVMRPKNDNLEATEICRRLMSREAIQIIKGM